LLDTVRRAGGNQVVARRSGIPLATVNNYVRGRNGMKIGPLAAMAQACTVSLEWLVFGDVSPARRAGADYPTASTDPPPGLGETPVAPFTAGDIDQRALAKAIEIVVVIAGAEDFREDTKGVARRIAATYAKLTEPEAPPG
jgi:transcriptional regulator with XRE-family HTH domain